MSGGNSEGKSKWEKLRSVRKKQSRKTRRISAPKGKSTCPEKCSVHGPNGPENLITRII